MKSNKTLSALTSMALALPAIAAAETDQQPQVDYQFSFYQENDNRMTVRAHQARTIIPIKDTILQLDLVKDVVSGASPMFIMPARSENGEPTQVLSGASIIEERDVANLGLSRTIQDWDIGLNVGVSSEDDYLSHSASAELGHDFNQKNTHLSLAYGVSLDDIGQTGNPSLQESKRSGDIAIGLSQLLDSKSIIEVNLGYGQHRGYLSDPYKKVFIRSAGIKNDVRPDGRYQWTAQLNYRRHLNEKIALNINYRYYHDNWAIQSHTITLGAAINLGHQWILRPSLRYYSQTQAYFHQNYFDNLRDDGYHSSDYRLAGFGAISPEIKLEKQFNDSLSLNLSWRYYRSDDSYQLGSNDSVLVDPLSFNLFNIGVSMRF